MLVSSISHRLWLITYDSFRMTHFVWLISYDSYLYFSRYSDGYHLAMVAIYFDRLGAQSSFQNVQSYSYHPRLVLILHKTERVADYLNKTVFLKTNNSLAKLTNSISSVSSFWQIRWKMTLDLRLVTNQFSSKYSLIPWTCEIFRTFSMARN